MPKKSTKDRAEGVLDKAKGRLKEAGGSLSGDGEKKAQGQEGRRQGSGTVEVLHGGPPDKQSERGIREARTHEHCQSHGT
jgi:uncharacterized protein YjbJ (UPF0337 family)